MNLCEFSPCRKYRYTWWPRDFCDSTPGRYCQFIGLNPSTADEAKADPTVRRCISFAKAWGYGGLCMTNLFAFRATDPEVMKGERHPVGIDNDRWLHTVAKDAGIVIAAWGNHGSHGGRAFRVRTQLQGVRPLHYLRLNASGAPAHPLYLPADLKPQEWLT